MSETKEDVVVTEKPLTFEQATHVIHYILQCQPVKTRWSAFGFEALRLDYWDCKNPSLTDIQKALPPPFQHITLLSDATGVECIPAEGGLIEGIRWSCTSLPGVIFTSYHVNAASFKLKRPTKTELMRCVEKRVKDSEAHRRTLENILDK